MKGKKGQIDIKKAMDKALENNDNYYKEPEASEPGGKKGKSPYKQMSVSVHETDKKKLQELMHCLISGNDAMEISQVNTSNVFRACLAIVHEMRDEEKDKIKNAYRAL